MKQLIISLLATASIFLSTGAQSQQLESCAEYIQLGWTPPTTRTDGSALASNEIDSYEIVLTGAATATISVPAPATSFTHDNPITDCAAGSIAYAIATVDTSGNVSELSDSVSLVLAGGYQGKESIPSSVNFDSGSVEQKSVITVPSCTAINQFGCKR